VRNTQVVDTVVNAPATCYMRRVRGAYNASTFDAYVKAARAGGSGNACRRWNPPATPLWKGVYHVHRYVPDRMSSAAFGAAIRRGWDDTGILPAEEDGKPRPVQYSALMRPKVVRRSVAAHQLSSALGGDVFAVSRTRA
jgi:hypothetical protein